MYILLLAIGIPKQKASKLYWDVYLPILVGVAMIALVRAGYIHG